MAKQQTHQQFQLLFDVAIQPEPTWVRLMELPDQPSPLVFFMLPKGFIRFSPQRGYWAHMLCLHDESGARWLLLQINSFQLETGPGRSWAIPFDCERSPHEQLLADLGFRQGWEESVPETLLLFDSQWREPFQDMLSNGTIGLSEEGAPSLYPMALDPTMIEEMNRYTMP
ncbi:MAG: hypothetical protein U0931_14145 [Vulcanimicrobiota bacterium]